MPGSTPARRSSRSSFRPMLVTIWMCTHEWSLICSRVTAFTLAACQSAFSDVSWLARSTTSRSVRLPRAGRVMRMSRTASAGVMRAPRSARTLIGLPGSGSAPAGTSSGSAAESSSALMTENLVEDALAAGALLVHRHDAPAEGERVVVPAGAGAHVVERDAVTRAVAVDRPVVPEVDAGVVDGRRCGVDAVRGRAPEQDVAGMQAGARSRAPSPGGRRPSGRSCAPGSAALPLQVTPPAV